MLKLTVDDYKVYKKQTRDLIRIHKEDLKNPANLNNTYIREMLEEKIQELRDAIRWANQQIRLLRAKS